MCYHQNSYSLIHIFILILIKSEDLLRHNILFCREVQHQKINQILIILEFIFLLILQTKL